MLIGLSVSWCFSYKHDTVAETETHVLLVPCPYLFNKSFQSRSVKIILAFSVELCLLFVGGVLYSDREMDLCTVFSS